MNPGECRLSETAFRERLERVGTERYHHLHPFHLMMHEGRLSRSQLQAWALNRYYYQSVIPNKDAIILARAEDPDFRRHWRKRIEDHDGAGGRPGGIEKWLRLAEGLGLSREEVTSLRGLLPGVRYSVDAYLQFVSSRTFLEAVASSLTEMFSGRLIALRIARLRELYPWLGDSLHYFQDRLHQAPEDAAFALAYVVSRAESREQQEACIRALEFKCDLLWAQLDAIHHAYVSPATPPPGARIF